MKCLKLDSHSLIYFNESSLKMMNCSDLGVQYSVDLAGFMEK